jgi:hypothetical protein
MKWVGARRRLRRGALVFVLLLFESVVAPAPVGASVVWTRVTSPNVGARDNVLWSV